jgi:hypothetical protein
MPKKQRQQQKKRASIAEKERVQSRTEEKGKGETTEKIINREKKRAVKRIHLKRLAILFSQIALQFVYILQNRHLLPTSNNPLCLRIRHTISYIRLKEHPTFCILLSKTDYPILLCITEKPELIEHRTRLKKEDEQNHLKMLWQKSCLER